MTLIAIAVLAVGTYAFRVCGPLLHNRLELTDRARSLLSLAATTLLCAMVATSALTADHGFSGWSRTAGVLVGAVLALRRLPFLVAVVAAMCTTAGLRLLGVN